MTTPEPLPSLRTPRDAGAGGRTPAPVASSPRSAPPERAQDPAGPARAVDADPAGTSGQEFLKRYKTATSGHAAAKLRGRFTRAAKKTGPGMMRVRQPEPPDGPDAA